MFGVIQLHFQVTASEIPYDWSLQSVYPNPFNGQTTIHYTLKESAVVSVTIHDLQGRMVKVLVDEFQSAGKHSVIWDTGTSGYSPLTSGIYFCQLQFKRDEKLLFNTTAKAVLIK